MLNQWLNQMDMDAQRQQQKLFNDFMGTVVKEGERQKKYASATCSLLPSENDRFFGYITLLYLGSNEIELVMTDRYGNKEQLSSSDYFFSSGTIVTSAIFAPGTTLTVLHNATGKILSTKEIPLKSSTQYNVFVRQGRALAQALYSQKKGVYDSDCPVTDGGMNSRNNSSVTCTLCGGKGWIVGSKTPTYGSSSKHWCLECDREVNASHSHDKCPSCSGLGYIKIGSTVISVS